MQHVLGGVQILSQEVCWILRMDSVLLVCRSRSKLLKWNETNLSKTQIYLWINNMTFYKIPISNWFHTSSFMGGVSSNRHVSFWKETKQSLGSSNDSHLTSPLGGCCLQGTGDWLAIHADRNMIIVSGSILYCLPHGLRCYISYLYYLHVSLI